MHMTPDEFRLYLMKDIKKWSIVAEAAGLKPQ